MSSIDPGDERDPQPIAFLSNQRTILVVEDEDNIRTLIVSVLGREGYCLLQAANGADAYELCVLSPRKVDLMITDLTMPLMSGVELVRKVFTIKPDMRVIMLSGRSSETLRKIRGVSIFTKPFTIKSLLAKITEVLGQAI